MKTKERSRKAKEAQADYLMKISVSLFTAFFIAILIVPITVIMQSTLSENPEKINILTILVNIGFTKGIIFLICEIGVFYIADKYRGQALDIYDELYPDQ